MGNANTNFKGINTKRATSSCGDLQNQVIVDFTGNSSLTSRESHQSFSNTSRPWFKNSKKRWKRSVSSHDISKTAWPVSRIEQVFLPEFPSSPQVRNQQFAIVDDIATGSFGKVFRIQDLKTHNYYALKVLPKSQIIKDNCIEQVKNEVLIQAACGHHPFIVKCHSYWQSKKQLFIVTDYIEGGELFALLKTYSSLPLDLVKIYVAELAIVLDFLHNAGVIYRDLKPENILLDREGHLYLTDFGLSKWLSFGVKTRTLCGTLRYMAPEVISLQLYGHAADWWSLGVITCLMMLGQFPVSAVANENNEKSDNRKKPGTLPDDIFIDNASKDLLLRLLEVDPTKRLRSLRVMKTIAFFKGFNFEAIEAKQVRPSDILEKRFPAGPPSINEIHFNDF
ncbi:serine/threonine-protein kinase S6KL [Agrilus planipennis]|uniref:Serine/threonine-protein kinase S6KL n=1 Tax=Agrilus planipennis TaxID=224129 RepID=A0A1W4WUS3_AGRPL|nr:serine/threonine-protein kinase S6KL [Agrilus planipennis]